MTHILTSLKAYRSMLPSVLLCLAAGWLAACSSSDDEMADALTPTQPGAGEPARHAIGFDHMLSASEEGVTRAPSQPLQDLGVTEFHVWGYKNTTLIDDRYESPQFVFNKYTVKYKAGSAGTAIDNTHNWYYVGELSGDNEVQTPKYWDYSAKAYRFMATTGEVNSLAHWTWRDAEGEWWATSMYGNIHPDAKVYFSRLWFSNNNYPTWPAYGEPVKLEFFRPFCRVRIMFIDEHGNPLTASSEVVAHITKGSIDFSPTSSGRKISNQGNFFVKYPITGNTLTETFEPDPHNDVSLSLPYESHTTEADYALVDPSQKEQWYTLFPNHIDADFTLSMVYDGMARKAQVPAAYMTWETNHEYTYVFKVGPKELSFEPYLYVHKEWQSGYTPDTPAEW